jgi:hypothetical protein
MRCQKCSAENPPAAKFCIQCATPLKRRCAKAPDIFDYRLIEGNLKWLFRYVDKKRHFHRLTLTKTPPITDDCDDYSFSRSQESAVCRTDPALNPSVFSRGCVTTPPCHCR